MLRKILPERRKYYWVELAILRGHVAVKAPKTVDPLDIKGAKENSDVFSSHSLGMQS